MTCLPVVGLVPKFGQKLNALGRELGRWELQGRKLQFHQECGTGCFAAFPLFGNSEPVGFGERDMEQEVSNEHLHHLSVHLPFHPPYILVPQKLPSIAWTALYLTGLEMQWARL